MLDALARRSELIWQPEVLRHVQVCWHCTLIGMQPLELGINPVTSCSVGSALHPMQWMPKVSAMAQKNKKKNKEKLKLWEMHVPVSLNNYASLYLRIFSVHTTNDDWSCIKVWKVQRRVECAASFEINVIYARHFTHKKRQSACKLTYLNLIVNETARWRGLNASRLQCREATEICVSKGKKNFWASFYLCLLYMHL